MPTAEARFATIYERHYRHVYAYCRRRTTSDRVDDAVAEVFLVAWRRISDVPEGDATLPWLYAVAYRALRNTWRSASRASRLEQRLAALGMDSVVAVEDFVITRHESRQVLTALSRLRETDREILLLSIWEGLSHSEIAIVLDVSVEAARQRLSRARKNLVREHDRTQRTGAKPPVAQKGGAW